MCRIFHFAFTVTSATIRTMSSSSAKPRKRDQIRKFLHLGKGSRAVAPSSVTPSPGSAPPTSIVSTSATLSQSSAVAPAPPESLPTSPHPIPQPSVGTTTNTDQSSVFPLPRNATPSPRQTHSAPSPIATQLKAAGEAGWSVLREVLKGVRDVSDVFPPLKSAAAGLVLVMERVDVSHFFWNSSDIS